jgi:hypothetical protein
MYAGAINAAGDILLQYTMGAGSHLAIRSGRTGVLRPLQLPPGFATAIPIGLSDDGTATAHGAVPDGLETSFVWTANGALRVLPGTTTGVDVLVQASAGRWAVGIESDRATGAVTPLRWDLRTQSVQQLPAGLTPESVNPVGTVGGRAGPAEDAALVQNGAVVQLPRPAGTIAADATALTTAGAAAGSVIDAEFLTHAVTWTCSVPMIANR